MVHVLKLGSVIQAPSSKSIVSGRHIGVRETGAGGRVEISSFERGGGVGECEEMNRVAKEVWGYKGQAGHHEHWGGIKMVQLAEECGGLRLKKGVYVLYLGFVAPPVKEDAVASVV